MLAVSARLAVGGGAVLPCLDRLSRLGRESVEVKFFELSRPYQAVVRRLTPCFYKRPV